MRKYLILFLVFTSFHALAQEADLGKYFRENNLNGTLVISSLDGDTQYVYNRRRAKKQYLPASTFKIPNTLIALEEKVFAAETDTFKWNGTTYQIPEWNANQTLVSAFQVSCVWCYQQLARELSIPKYEEWLRKMNYGNQRTGPVLDEFWLNGDIRISAFQQIQFLQKFYSGNLPVSQTSIQQVKRIMLADKNQQYTLYGKTGWALRVKHKVGWYVGFVEVGDKVWIFACNLDMSTDQNAPHRKAAVYAGLRELGIIKTQ